MVVRAGYQAAAAPASCNSSRVGWVWLPWVNRGSTGPGIRRMASLLSSQEATAGHTTSTLVSLL